MNSISDYRIVADSAADIESLGDIAFCEAPLKIRTGEREFNDTDRLNIAEMVDFLKTYKGKSSSSCPNADEWLAAFGDAKYVLGVTLSSNISGSYNAALIAKDIYEAEHPDRKVFIVDSRSAGPQELLIAEKAAELIRSGLDFDSVCSEISAYQKQTGILFMLESLTNFANNGRVSHAVAKIAGLLSICVICKASREGTIELIDKSRGAAKSICALVEQLKANGYSGGRARIAHCFNEEGAQALKAKILAEYPSAEVLISSTGGLCSFYAEKGGLLLAFEKNHK